MKLYELQVPKEVNSRDSYKDWSRACRGKRGYFSKGDAQTVIDSGKIGNPSDLEPYNCKFCRSWHVGHTRRFYRELRKRAQQARRIPYKERLAYLNQIRRLQEQNHVLTEALAEERQVRRMAINMWRGAEARYEKRLKSRLAWLVDLVAITVRRL